MLLIRGHAKSILCLAVVSDLVCSGLEDKTVCIWRGVQKEYSCLADAHLHDVVLYFKKKYNFFSRVVSVRKKLHVTCLHARLMIT